MVKENLEDFENEHVKQIEDVENRITPNGTSVRMAMWLCKHCGNEFVASVNAVKSGNTTSCGCRNRQIVSERGREITKQKIFIENKKFGMLTPISFADDYISPNGKHFSQILCKCDCGNEMVVRANSLLNGDTTSCGCRTMSKAAQNINDALSVLHIPFIKELHLPGCFNPETGVLLPFDFAILDENERVKALIEYQGEQHYRDTGEFGRLQRELTDRIKREFCSNSGIALQEIRFNEDEIAALKKILKEIL